jgi:hypothetical protein
MIAKLFLGGVIAAAAISIAAPTSADPGNPFSHLCMDSQCSRPDPAPGSHGDTSQVQAGIRQGLHDMQSAISPGRRPS